MISVNVRETNKTSRMRRLCLESCVCECGKHCHCVKCPYSELFWSAFSRIRTEYSDFLKDCKCRESLIDDALFTCDDIVDTPETISINPGDKTNYWILDILLVAIACLILVVVIVVKYYMNAGLAIPCLLLY